MLNSQSAIADEPSLIMFCSPLVLYDQNRIELFLVYF
jgi:hypothetical protein